MQTKSSINDDPGEAALARLLAIAQTDPGKPRCVATFLLAGWKARACGGFDLTELWIVGPPIREDMLAVIQMIARDREHATAYGHEKAFEALVECWRPNLARAPR